MPNVVSARQRHNILVRHHGPDSPLVAQARHALELAKTEHAVAAAIQTAPPLDDDTLARLHALIPAPTTGGEQA